MTPVPPDLSGATTLCVALLILLALIGADWMGRVSRGHAPLDARLAVIVLWAICSAAALSLASYLGFASLAAISAATLVLSLVAALVLALNPARPAPAETGGGEL